MRIRIFQRNFNQGTGLFGSVMRIFAFLLMGSLAMPVLAANSGAKDWPTKPITLIVPWPAGASTDFTGRTLSTKLSKILGVPVSVVNKPGGGGITGTLEAVKATPDGYTLFVDCGGSSSIQYAWSQNLPYKVEERTYIARAIYTTQSLIVPASTPWKTVADLENAIRTDPGKISFALIGGTGVPDVDIAQFRAALMAKGVDVSKTRSVTYKGTGEVLPAVAGGHVSFSFSTPSGSNPLVSAGKLRALAVTSAERYKGWPNVPTMTEAGFPSVDMVYWAGLGGPPGMPANIVKILDNAVRESLNDPDVIASLDKYGLVPFYQSGDKYRKFVLDEGEAVKALKLR